MKFTSRIGGAAIAALALVALPVTAAGAATTTVTTTPVCGDMEYSPFDFTNNLIELPQFDPALGELMEAKVSGNVTLRGSVDVENDAPASTEFEYSNAYEGTITVPGAEAIDVSDSIDGAVLLAASDGTLDFQGASSFSSGVLTSFQEIPLLSITAPDLSPYIGDGTLEVDFSGTGRATSNGDSNLLVAFRAGALATVCVSYTYLVTTVDPEPPIPPKTLPAAGTDSALPGVATSAALLGLGAALFAAARRGRARQNG